MLVLIAGALGGALGSATIFFPVTYFAMKGQFKLKPLGGMWKEFGISIVGIAVLHLFGLGLGGGQQESWVEMMTFIVLPIVVSAAVLVRSSKNNPV
jgi:hypothetical protein